MKDIAIYGAGGLGREVAAAVRQINEVKPTWKLVGFFDDGLPLGKTVDDLTVLGGINELNEYPASLSVLVAMASPALREKVVQQIENKLISFPSLVHPAANLGDVARNKWGKGCLFTAGVILTTGITLGDFVIVNLSTTIGHDATIGDFTSIMPGCCISGEVKMGGRVSMGARSCILPRLIIPDESVIGAGAVVTKSFSEKVKLVGVPARNILS